MPIMRTVLLVGFLLSAALAFAQTPPADQFEYVKKGTRAETIRATLAANGLPNLGGKWYVAGPFEFPDGTGFEAVLPPEKGVDL